MIADDRPAPSGERAPDPRPARSRAAVFRAVEALSARRTEESSFTVMAILRESGISRGTFYTHFPTLEDLAEQMFEQRFALIGEADRTDRRAALASAARDPQADLRRPAEDSQLALARFVEDHRPFLRATLDWRVSSQVRESVIAAHATQVRETLRVMGPSVPPHLDHEAFSLMIAGGTVALLTAWLRDEDPITPEAMAERLLSTMPDWFVGSAAPSDPPVHASPHLGPVTAPTDTHSPGGTS
ncbi:TetR/AcrR family transcriptional regulator [Brachybacterium sp. FME24]|uniref:TetR/AcrR family transcriptional regulator n=1 Tax=Brachybacterium sp. FME24 TaxID=2742605 RepID=UPI001867EAF9|nr:TetR/AcrR family transcriptional regulator [Brachybacterium sp. FME24]